MDQIDLFSELPPGCRVRAKRRTACTKPFTGPIAVQLAFDLAAPVDDGDDDPLITAPMSQRTVSAKDAAPMAIKGPCSVWAMAVTPVALKRQAPPVNRAITRVERGDGLVKCVRIMESETEEYKAKEVARRARQSPPKPTQAFKRLSSKLQALVS